MTLASGAVVFDFNKTRSEIFLWAVSPVSAQKLHELAGVPMMVRCLAYSPDSRSWLRQEQKTMERT